MTQKKKPVPILVVEDSPEDFEVLERACKKAGFDVPLYRCKNGEEAVNLLYKEGEFEHYPSDANPALILLDLNLPGLDGHALMETIKDDQQLRYIPIIVLSTSGSSDDVLRSYQNGANSYIQKPEDMQGYVSMVQDIKTYWFCRSKIPFQRMHV